MSFEKVGFKDTTKKARKRPTKMIPYINKGDHMEMGRIGNALLLQFKSQHDSPKKAMDGFVMNSVAHARTVMKAMLMFLKLNDDREDDKSRMVVIEGVRWRRQTDDPQIYPAGDTDQFAKLVGLNRGLLIFIPDVEDSGAVRDRFSDLKPEGPTSGEG